jgi:uncharacterized membrane protein
MRGEKLIWVGSFATIFFFLPSLAFKGWELLAFAPWPAKRWLLIYPVVGLVVYWGVRRRWRQANRRIGGDDHSLLFLAKQRLVKGEISVAEFREIRQALKTE